MATHSHTKRFLYLWSWASLRNERKLFSGFWNCIFNHTSCETRVLVNFACKTARRRHISQFKTTTNKRANNHHFDEVNFWPGETTYWRSAVWLSASASSKYDDGRHPHGAFGSRASAHDKAPDDGHESRRAAVGTPPPWQICVNSRRTFPCSLPRALT